MYVYRLAIIISLCTIVFVVCIRFVIYSLYPLHFSRYPYILKTISYIKYNYCSQFMYAQTALTDWPFSLVS